MDNINKETEEITLIISFESSLAEKIKCKFGDKIEDIIINFASKINENHSSFIILYSGTLFNKEDLQKTFLQKMSKDDIERKNMNILIYRKSPTIHQENDVINIILIINSKDSIIIKGKKQELIKDIIQRNSAKIGQDINNMIFKYGNDEIQLDQKFDDFANNRDKIFSGITLLAYTKNVQDINESQDRLTTNEMILRESPQPQQYTQNNDNCFKLFMKNHKKLLIILSSLIIAIIIAVIIIVIKLKKPEEDEVNNSDSTENSEEQIKTDIISNKPKESDEPIKSDISSDKPKSSNEPIKSDISSDKPESSEILKKTENIQTDIDSHISYSYSINGETKECEEGYYIPDDSTSYDCVKCSLERCAKCKGTYEYDECIDCGYYVGVYNGSKISKCNNTCIVGYKLVNNTCRPDFLINATFQANRGATIDLFPSGFKSYISQMFIDGKKISPISSHQYQFESGGNHIVYLKISKVSGSPQRSLFSQNTHLISVSFTDFDEYIPNVSFEFIFNGCKNLTSVDLSKIKIKSNKMSCMFNGCEKLKYVNLNFKSPITAETPNIQYMFKNCKSLTSVDLSKVNVSQIIYFEEMFYGCTSLEEINLENFEISYKSSIYIDSMFYNCTSLKSLDLSSFKPKNLYSMKKTFYNCYSLTSINLDKLYSNLVVDMSHLFYNCSSLKFLNLSDMLTEKIHDMRGMFQNCKSLTSILFSKNFDTTQITDILMGHLFYNCHSLTRINFPDNFIIRNSNLTYLFANCYSLTSIDMAHFDFSTTWYYNSMFQNCYNLTSIDASNFNFIFYNNQNQITNMFSGCYSLTSIDFSIYNNIPISYDGLFFDCPNLHYINISFITNLDSYRLFNTNISSYRTLFLNKEYNKTDSYKKNIYPPQNWTLILR